MNPVAVVTVVIAIVAVLATGFAYFRSSAVKVWEQNSKAYQARVELLEADNKELLKKISFMEQRIHELEARPNWDQVVAMTHASADRVIAAVRVMQAETAAQNAAIAAALAKEKP